MCKWVQIDSLHTQCKLESQFCSAQLSVTLPLHYYFCAVVEWQYSWRHSKGWTESGESFLLPAVTSENKAWTTEHRLLASLLMLDVSETLHRNKCEEKTTMPIWPLHLQLITKPLPVLYTRSFTGRIQSPEMKFKIIPQCLPEWSK